MSESVNYLREVLRLLIDRSLEAKTLARAAGLDDRQRLFEEGRALAYYEVVSMLLGQAYVFGLDKDVVPELDFDPDRELLS